METHTKRKIRVIIINCEVANEIIYDLITFKLLSFYGVFACVCANSVVEEIFTFIYMILLDVFFVLRPPLSLSNDGCGDKLNKKKTNLCSALPADFSYITLSRLAQTTVNQHSEIIF